MAAGWLCGCGADEALACRLEAIATRVEAIAIRVEAIATSDAGSLLIIFEIKFSWTLGRCHANISWSFALLEQGGFILNEEESVLTAPNS